MLGRENRSLVTIVPSTRDPSAPGLRPVAQDDKGALAAGFDGEGRAASRRSGRQASLGIGNRTRVAVVPGDTIARRRCCRGVRAIAAQSQRSGGACFTTLAVTQAPTVSLPG